MSRDIFFKKMAAFWYFLRVYTFFLNLNVSFHTGGGGGVRVKSEQYHQMTQEGWGLKLDKKVYDP